ncbi:lipopolysaccharide biosynthesis protein [Marinicrinis sediminis]|uniref:Lipopolysaccharide biosynthesis protein n=1 Tax=Marinicrinis sediminis TaxID=1652465 RepID=A0ABW5RE90_9BACL
MKTLRIRRLWSWPSLHSELAHTLRTTAASVFILAVNVITGMITARVLGPDGRGDQAAMLIWSQFLPFVLTFGLPTALLFRMKTKPEQASAWYGSAVCLAAVIGLLAIGIGWWFIPAWLDGYDDQVVRFACWSMLQAPVVMLLLMNNAVLQAIGDFKSFNQMRYLPPIFTLLLLCGLWGIGQLTAVTTVLAYLLPTVPLVCWMTVLIIHRIGISFHEPLVQIRRLFHYGLRSYGIDLLTNVSNHLDKVILVLYLSPVELGLYVVAVSLSRMAQILYSSVIVVLLPKVSGQKQEEVLRWTGRAFRITTMLSVIGAGMAMWIAPWLLQLLYGDAFLSSVPLFRLLVMEVVIGGGVLVLAQGFMALDRPGSVAILQGIGLGLTLPLIMLLVPTYGMMGAGWAVLIATCVRFVGICIQYPLLLGARPPAWWFYRDDWRFLLSRWNRRAQAASANEPSTHADFVHQESTRAESTGDRQDIRRASPEPNERGPSKWK